MCSSALILAAILSLPSALSRSVCLLDCCKVKLLSKLLSLISRKIWVSSYDQSCGFSTCLARLLCWEAAGLLAGWLAGWVPLMSVSKEPEPYQTAVLLCEVHVGLLTKIGFKWQWTCWVWLSNFVLSFYIHVVHTVLWFSHCLSRASFYLVTSAQWGQILGRSSINLNSNVYF